MSGSDGLTLQDGDRQFQFPAVEAAQVYRHSVKVTPASEGLYLLTLSVNLQHDQTSESRVFSVPILVGEAAREPGAGAAKPAGTAAQQKEVGQHRGS